VTDLRSGGKYGMGFVAYYMDSKITEEFRKSSNICKSYTRMCRGMFFFSQCMCLLSWH